MLPLDSSVRYILEIENYFLGYRILTPSIIRLPLKAIPVRLVGVDAVFMVRGDLECYVGSCIT